MSSVTAVPLQPIRKGSVGRLWLGVALVLLVALALAWNGLRGFGHSKSGLAYQILETGTPGSPTRDDFVQVSYKGMLDDGTVFDESPQPTPMDLTSMIPGFAEAVTMLGKGGRMRVRIPPELAYGDQARGEVIPANSTLVFEITLHDFRTRAEVMELQRQMQMQQMLQQQLGGGGGGAPMPMPEGAPGQP